MCLRQVLQDMGLGRNVYIGGYANGFLTVSGITGVSGAYRQDISPDVYWKDFASAWVDEAAGTRGVIVGGCCGIFPEHMRAVTEGLARSRRGGQNGSPRRKLKTGKISKLSSILEAKPRVKKHGGNANLRKNSLGRTGRHLVWGGMKKGIKKTVKNMKFVAVSPVKKLTRSTSSSDVSLQN